LGAVFRLHRARRADTLRLSGELGMRRFLLWLILLPVAIVGVAFAVANRQIVEINFDPFAASPAQQIEIKAPLFLAIILVLAVGVVIGGFFTWIGQGNHRRALREARGEMSRLRSDVERMKT
jgi:uncharacterized metal-binding protein